MFCTLQLQDPKLEEAEKAASAEAPKFSVAVLFRILFLHTEARRNRRVFARARLEAETYTRAPSPRANDSGAPPISCRKCGRPKRAGDTGLNGSFDAIPGVSGPLAMPSRKRVGQMGMAESYREALMVSSQLGKTKAVHFYAYGALAVGGIVCLILDGTMLVDSPTGFLHVSLEILIPIALGFLPAELYPDSQGVSTRGCVSSWPRLAHTQRARPDILGESKWHWSR